MAFVRGNVDADIRGMLLCKQLGQRCFLGLAVIVVCPERVLYIVFSIDSIRGGSWDGL